LGRVPKARETILHPPVEMTIESADARKIRRVRIKMLDEPPDSETASSEN
jgi:Mg2+/Co2+ transporter CorC